MITIQPSTSTKFTKAELIKPSFKVPSNVKLYLKPFADGTYLLRFQNMDENNEVFFLLNVG